MNKQKILLIAIIFINFATVISAQTTVQIKALVIDSETSVPLIYATVFNKTSKSGTVSDRNGSFLLKKNKLGDTIIISYIGYKTKEFVLNEYKIDTISLNPKKNLLDEIVILGNNSFLYKLLYDCHKTKNKKVRTAKTYFSVESYRNDKKIELIEIYYNGLFKGYDIEDLKLKNGRIAYRQYKNKNFTSTQTSFAILYNKLFKKSKLYPMSPLSLSKRKMMKYYNLSIDSKYKNSNNEIIFVVQFEPKIKDRKFYYGKVWINKNTNQVIKINLKIKKSEISPFIPLHIGFAKIDLLELNISKSFININGEMYIKSIDFKYTINYNPSFPKGSPSYLISTKAFLYAYNYTDEFILPKFRFNNNMYQDYLNVSAFPYNLKFWNNIKDFSISEFYEKTDSFVNYDTSYLNKNFSERGMFGEKTFFVAPYFFWSKDRISFREDFDLTKYQKLLPSDRYNFNVQIYMDINIINDTIDVLTKTIFDPNFSFYHFKQAKESTAFINMYFDLIEIQRRKFIEKIDILKKKNIVISQKLNQINTLYQETNIEIKKQSLDFFKDVQRGYNKEGVNKWNAYIYNKLGLDNISIFKLNTKL